MPKRAELNLLNAHLKKMESFENRTERKEYIMKMSLEEMALIVLAARESFIKRVDAAIPLFNSLPILFIIGGTGAGKSTTLSFLRGDKMTLKDFNYESGNADQIIDHELSTSKTILPNIFKTKDYIIVDYPGFESTYGPLIDLGIDLALKAHLLQYQPEVLVLDSITNIGGKCAALAKLASHLSRLIKDYKKNVVLGITKYSQDCDYREIQKIESEQTQQKIQRQEPSLEEILLEASINQINELIEALKPHKEIFQKKSHELHEAREKLHELQEARQKIQMEPLPDNPKKNVHTLAVKEKEQALSNEIGPEKFIQLKELERPDRLKFILGELKNKCTPCIVEPRRLMHPEHQQLLNNKFTNDFITHWASQPCAQTVQKFSNFAAVEKAITESSLINAILAKDIGVLFHLPQMPLSTLIEMDEKLMDSFLEPYLESIIKLACSKNIKKLPGDVNARALQNKIKNLRRYLHEVLGLKGTEIEKECKLNEREGKIELGERSLPERFKPSWTNHFTYLNPKEPKTLETLFENMPKEISSTQALNAIAEIESLQTTLKELLKIKQVVHRTKISLSEKQQKREIRAEQKKKAEEEKEKEEHRLREEKQKKKKEGTYYRILDPETVAFFKDTKNSECVEGLRRQLNLLARQSVPLSSVAYKALLALVELKPVNEVDPSTLEEISNEDKIIVTEGQQFSLTKLIQFHNMRPNRDDEINGKFLINTYTNAPFVAVDAALVLEIAKKRKIKITGLNSVNLVQQCDSLPPEKTLGSDDKSTEMQQLSDKISSTTIAIREYMYDGATTDQLNELKKTLTRLTKNLASFLENTEDHQLSNTSSRAACLFFKYSNDHNSTHLHTDYVSANNP
ncbi:TPA: GTPase domain-containing protein [Legionella pneumophila]|nr:GTPase domain-containing protein [Legionella pneumophila]